MAKKPTYEELEQWVKDLEKEAIKRKQAELALQESEERFRLLSEASFEGVLIHDKAKILDANQTFADVFGYKLDEIIGMNILELAAPESRDLVKKNMLSGFEQAYEAVGLRKDGAAFPGELRGREIEYKGNTVRLTAARDLSKQKDAEKTLRESEAKYRLLAENAADVIWTRDMDLNLTYISPSIERLTGFTIQEAAEIPILRRMTPTSIDKINNAFMEELALEEQGGADPLRTRTLELEQICKDNSTVPVEITMSPICNSDEKAVGIMGITRDITDRKKAEKKLKKLHEELEKRVEQRTQELASTNKELQEKTLNIKEANTALKVLLKRREEDQTEVEEKILANVSELIIPAIDTLKGTKTDDRQATWIEILETNLRDIVSPFSQGLSSKHWRLTPMEFQVANFIRRGKTTKEIAGLLHVATSTINTYRDNIRKKLGIKNRKINLKTYLSDLE